MTIIPTTLLSRSTDIILELIQILIQKGDNALKRVILQLQISHHHCDGSIR